MRKKYSVILDDDRVIGVEVDGKRYNSPADVPDLEDQVKLEFMVDSFSDLSDTHSSADTKMPGVVFWVFAGVTALMLVITLLSAFLINQSVAREVSAPGQVVDLVPRRDSEGQTFYYPVVEMTLPDASTVTVNINVGSSPPAYQPGNQVTVLYDPANPQQGRIESFWGNIGVWTLPLITGVLFLAFLTASFFARWVGKN